MKVARLLIIMLLLSFILSQLMGNHNKKKGNKGSKGSKAPKKGNKKNATQSYQARRILEDPVNKDENGEIQPNLKEARRDHFIKGLDSKK